MRTAQAIWLIAGLFLLAALSLLLLAFSTNQSPTLLGAYQQLCVCVFLPVYVVLPTRWRPSVFISVSIAFSAAVFSPVLTLLLLTNVLVLYVCLRGRSIGLAFFIFWTVCFYVAVPAYVLHLTHAFFLESYAWDVVLDFLFWSTFKRSIFCYWEVWTGTVKNFSFPSLVLYMMGLPFLGPDGAEPSFRHFMDCASDSGPEFLASLRSGIITSFYCTACYFLWLYLPYQALQWGVTPFTARPSDLLIAIAVWFLCFYFRRVASEQGSVGLCRLFGYRMRDNFAPTVLLSKNPADFWRGWNALWREFLVSAFYYPTVLWLGRRFHKQSPWMIAVGGLVTFAGAALFDIFPVVFVHFFSLTPLLMFAILRGIVSQLIWGVVVSTNLYFAARNPRRKRPVGWTVPFRVAFTLTIVLLLMLYRRVPTYLVSAMMMMF